MLVNIRHSTRFSYSAPVCESIMELRMRPRTEGAQRCLGFDLAVSPAARVFSYHDHLGNEVHQFDIPGLHRELAIVAETTVEVLPQPAPPEALGADGWARLDAAVAASDFWEFLQPSDFVHETTLLAGLREEFGAFRDDDPLALVHRLSARLHESFAYAPRTTRVDSPIDEALAQRQGVCQDFTHVLLALLRPLGIPARYVSGYVMQRDAGFRSSRGASHAWVEAWMPGLGWVGIDPTNNVPAGERHVRTAVGRDYADVPPTRGVFKGLAESELSVVVVVTPYNSPLLPDEAEAAAEWDKARAAALAAEQAADGDDDFDGRDRPGDAGHQQQQQQQQQQ